MVKVNDVSREFVSGKVDSKLGQKRQEVSATPATHFDYSIISLSDEKVMGVASDDAVYYDKLTPDKSSFLTFHRSAGKLVSTGIMPEYLGISLHMPAGVEEDDLAHYWNSINIESKKFQVSITSRNVTVHDGVKGPMVGGTTVSGTARNSFYVTPGSALHGDRILLTKTPGIEAATLIAQMLPEAVEEKAGAYNRKMAQKLFFKTSTVQEAQEALKFGFGKDGVTSMKNVGSGGLVAALNEFASTGGFGLDVNLNDIPLYDEVKEICSNYGLNPFTTGSMGCMLITIPESISEDLVNVLVGNGIDVADIGKVDRESNVIRMNGFEDKDEKGSRSFGNRLHEIISGSA